MKTIIPDLKISEKTLDNGLKVLLCEKPELPIVSVQLWVATGSIHEGGQIGSGLSHFLEHMVFNGTEKYPKTKLAEVCAENGGYVNAGTSHAFTCYFIDIIYDSAELAFDIISDAMISPKFPEDAFANEKDVILRERAMCSDNPSRLALETLFSSAFLEHPIRHPVIGYADKIVLVDRPMMLDYFNRRYSPGRSFLSVSGKISEEKTFSLAEKYFSPWKRGILDEPPILPEAPQMEFRRAEKCFRDPLHRTAMLFHVPEARHEDIPALTLLSMILGSNRSSRLVSRLQNEECLALGISSYLYSLNSMGAFGISAVCEESKCAKLEKRIFEELERLGDDKISEREIGRARLFIVNDYIRSMRSSHELASQAAQSCLKYGSPSYAKTFIETVSTIKRGEIISVAEKYLLRRNCTLFDLKPEGKDTAKNKSQPRAKCVASHSDPEIVRIPSAPRLILLRDKSLPLTDVCAIVPGGAFFEKDCESGSSALISELLAAGAKGMDENKIASILDDNALDFDCGQTANCMNMSISSHAERFDNALELFFRILSSPSFPEDKFAREKENALNHIASAKLAPTTAADNLSKKLSFGKHPYGRPSYGIEESIISMDRKRLSDYYYSNCLDPERMVFGVAGDFDRNEAIEKIEEYFSKVPWKKMRNMPPEPGDFGGLPARAFEEVPREQTVVFMSFPVCNSLSEDFYYLRFLADAMSGMNSRLFKKIRVDEGLAYSTGSRISAGFHSGTLSFYAAIQHGKVDDAIALMHKIRAELIENGLNGSEFKSAKSGMLRGIADIKSNKSALMEQTAKFEYFGLGIAEMDKFESIVVSASPEDVRKRIVKYLDTDSIAIAVAGPGK